MKMFLLMGDLMMVGKRKLYPSDCLDLIALVMHDEAMKLERSRSRKRVYVV